MNKLPTRTRSMILAMLCEGSSMRSISRLTDTSINTVSKLLVDAGNACAAFHYEKVRGVVAKHMRRFTRLTNAFSKKFENHAHMVALYTVWYNWCRIHKTLRITPAMAAGLTDRVWDLSDIVAFIDERAPKPGPRGPYKKRG